jgi:SAM-dependent methyltransferase
MFRSFLQEQTEPGDFYRDLARDTIDVLSHHEPLKGRTVIDVGAGPAQFAEEFSHAGASYVGLDLDVHTLGRTSVAAGVIARGEALPLSDGSVDVAMSSNVMEHVSQPGLVGRELLRVVRPGGLVFISYTAWASPWGGHETSPWHYFGGERAARFYERRNGHPPKNRYGQTMYPTRVADGLRWARSQPDAWLIEASPRYHPDWATWVVAVPGLREVATWNLMMVLRRKWM